MSLRVSLVAIAFAAMLSSEADASYTISLGSTTITAGNTNPVDIVATISGTTGLSEFQATFTITAAGSPTNPIPPAAFPQFVNASGPAADPTFNDPQYVFNNGNSGFAGSSTFGTASNPGTGFNTRFVGGDFFAGAGTGTPITGSNNHLADLLVDSTANHTTNAAGDTYAITLNLAGSSFFDASGNAVPSSSITVVPGTIVVTTGRRGSRTLRRYPGAVRRCLRVGPALTAPHQATRRLKRGGRGVAGAATLRLLHASHEEINDTFR